MPKTVFPNWLVKSRTSDGKIYKRAILELNFLKLLKFRVFATADLHLTGASRYAVSGVVALR